ncbi:hypothetical protein K1F50_14365 [Muricauda oceani]|uniref:HMA domain-containing protein n=1 Tax=Flagellimonas oceani TaxID=2698672 RepID=A0A6G7J2H0_9FLAO|nr:hypothetical protein [Allomuricauda oceani]MBW8243989.1 hypothetical protein [Allomuricauda oceani]QII44966.1 hypothetical protein GVT53_09825 [Allomuricauda oceani]
MITVHVFKTSVKQEGEVKQLRPWLNRLVHNNGHWNFDLEDCDNILRVESKNLDAPIISSLLHNKGFQCEELQ